MGEELKMAMKKRGKKGGVTQKRTLKRGPNKGDTVTVKASSASDLAKGNWYPVKVNKDRGSKNVSRVARKGRKKK
jgi:hypothetical protein